MSFAFSVVRPAGERFEQRDGMLTRIVSDMRIAEVSIVTFPSYTATDVTVAQRPLRAFQTHTATRIDLLRRALKAGMV